MDTEQLKYLVEAALLAAPEPQSIDQLHKLAESWAGDTEIGKPELREALKALTEDYAERGIELVEVASGFRVQVRPEMGPALEGLFEQRPPRYSRALFETLALIAYRQPITRGEIEDVRGVAVSSNIVRTLLEREWIRVVGHRDVPGKPAMFGTTKAFLDYFSLKKLDDLPSLAELTDMESLRIQLDLPEVDDGSGATGAPGDAEAVAEEVVAMPGGESAGEEAAAVAEDQHEAAPQDERGSEPAAGPGAGEIDTNAHAASPAGSAGAETPDHGKPEQGVDATPARAGSDSR
jgi:segregation and condensation protein B